MPKPGLFWIGEMPMQKYRCSVCGHIYDPAEGDAKVNIAPGTPFADLPEDWECPVCGADKDDFRLKD